MAARRTRMRRRRGGSGVLFKLLSIFVILAALIIGCIIFFRVDEIRVVGSDYYSDEQIIAASGVEKGDNLFLIRKVPTARNVLKELPYVKSIRPYFQLPDTQIFEIVDCTPVAIIQDQNGTWWLMDEDCKLLERDGVDWTAQYAQVTGLTPLMPSVGDNMAVSVEESGKHSALKEILSALKDRGMYEQVGDMDLSGNTEIIMSYQGRFRVRLPAYHGDFHRLIHTLEEIAIYLDDGQVGTVDLTGSRPRFIPEQS